MWPRTNSPLIRTSLITGASLMIAGILTSPVEAQRAPRSCDGRINSTVWHDLDHDGIQDPDEPGLSDVVVVLLTGDGARIAATATDLDGNFAFSGLCEGDYLVLVRQNSLPLPLVPTVCDAGRDDSIDSECSPASVHLDGKGSVEDTVDFGFAGLCNGAIGNFVWDDLDADGIQDEGEPGLPGVVVRLEDTNGNVLDSLATSEGGFYRFTALCQGTYVAVIDESTLPAGYVASPCDVGDDDSIDSDCSPALVVLPEITTRDRGFDFGFHSAIEEQQGCTPGYWKQSQHFDSWPSPYTPGTLFSDVFEDAFPGMTLVAVAGQGGGGLKALGRHVVAALLNAASDDVAYGMSAAEVIDAFDAVFPDGDVEGLKDDLAAKNEAGCPLN